MAVTVTLHTKRLTLRKYRPEDAAPLYEKIGLDPAMSQYSGWNPYATEEAARETVRNFIERYCDNRFYGWAIESAGRFIGTIGAYDYSEERDCIEVGISIVRDSWGRGCATEALKAVLLYLTQTEGIACVTAWCASDNGGSKRATEKAGMIQTGVEAGGLTVGNQIFDKLTFTYSGR